MKKLIFVLSLLAVLVAAGFRYFSVKAPEYIRVAIQRAVNKPVKIDSIKYQFPWTFELARFEILETDEPFVGERSFFVDKVYIQVSPLSLSLKELILDSVDASNAVLIVRNREEKLYHPLSRAASSDNISPVDSSPVEGGISSSGPELPLKIHHLHLGSSQFQWIDYDVQKDGSVIHLDQIEANIKDIALPLVDKKTLYRVEAKLAQGRAQRPASVKLSGWTDFLTYETDAMLTASDLHLPLFTTYVSQVTPARIEDGFLSVRGALRVHDKDLTVNADLQLVDLLFQSYEDGDQLFGLKAEEILNFLKDSSGHLNFQIVLQWPLDRPAEKSKLFRKAIEESIKKTLISNTGNILEKTLKSLSESGLDGSKDELEDTLKKVKKLFR